MPEEILSETYDDGMDGVALGPRAFLLMPHVRQTGPNQHEIPRQERRDIIPHDAIPGALQNERQLHLGMKMPSRTVTAPSHHFAME